MKIPYLSYSTSLSVKGDMHAEPLSYNLPFFACLMLMFLHAAMTLEIK